MPDLTPLFRMVRQTGPLLATLAFSGFAAAPAAAADAPLPPAIPAPGDALLVAEPVLPARYGQDTGDIDENILLPAARDDDDDERKWSRNYISVAGGVLSSPDYNGSDERRLLPAFYIRGRYDGYSFSTRGTNLQVDLIRHRRGQKTDFKFGPIISLRADRTGSIKDPQVEALGKRKLSVEAGFFTGVTHTGVITSDYDQIGFRLVALKDISGRHGSWAASPTIDYGTPLSKRAFVGVSASVNFYGKGFGRYYYDVDPVGSAASGLPVYTGAGARAGAGKYTLGLAGAYALSGDLRKGFVMIGGAQYGRLLSRLADSPIVKDVGSADQWLFGGGLAYQF
ncbi:MipA/OmpV family protein [Sphingopyxis sp.]|jgi:outer membrane protein|uniref:MipA/OmpV family protein n=1 Tax=Sphingopyxis sp. TaxID=1908224 RepID=UPI003F6EC450